MKNKLKYIILIVICLICPVIIAKPRHHKTTHRNYKPKIIRYHHRQHRHHKPIYIWVTGHYETQITISGLQIQVWIPGKYVLIN
jgi:hypothetical protein